MIKATRVNRYNVEKQYFTLTGDNVRQLASPLQQRGIMHFSHLRRWSGGEYALLTTEPQFSVTYIKEKFYNVVFGADHNEYAPGIVFIKDIENHCPLMKKAFVELTGMKPDLMLTEKHVDHTDFYWFGTHSTFETIYSFYMNHLPFLSQYLSYFKDVGASLLKKIYEARLVNEAVGNDITPLVSKNWQQRMGLDVLQSNKTIESAIVRLASSKNFTPKELNCALFLYDGFSPKEIAIETHRSYRTIEKHINSLKSKLESRSIVHLVSQLNKAC